MARAQRAKDKRIYQLKVTLEGSKPPIWRRVQVGETVRLGDLHAILQCVMGWTDSHLHQFIIKGEYYGAPSPGDFEDFEEMKDEDKFNLGGIVRRAKDKFVYEYDFGDGWKHKILVEKILPREAGVTYPRCLDGKRACPPEDCGGIWGYHDMLGAVADPKHPEHEELSEWLDDGFDPEAFDLEEVNKHLPKVCSEPRTWRMFH